MSSPFVGEIRIFCGNFAPVGWAICDGALLSIAQNDTLFALIGTTYGGDGQSTFAVPDLRGRAPMHMGQGASLSNRVIGQLGGTEASLTNFQSTQKLVGSGATAIVAPTPIPTMSPYLAVNFIISLFGIFPSQN